MGILPFVNEDGQRVVRWHRLVVIWLFIISATMFGSCTMGSILTGDWRYGAFVGMVMGVFFSTWVTHQGFTSAVDKLPPIPPRSSVMFFSRPGTADLEPDVRALRFEVADLKEVVDAQTSEMKRLHERLDKWQPGKSEGGKGKE
jgi:hypothetical protein